MDEVLESIENLPSRAYYGASLGSICLSIMLYIAGRKHAAMFVGLWAPTILSLALYSKLLRPSREDDLEDFEI